LLAQILKDAGNQYGVPGSALARLDALAAGKAVMVITGQQVGYLGGPLYTLLKACHATRLAAELEERLGLPVLPLFWLEGRDHDLEEVRDASYLTASGELRTLHFTPDETISGFEVGRYRVSADEHLRELTSAIDSPAELGYDVLRRAYSNTTLADAMGQLLASILGPRGLLVVEGMDPRLKALALPLWERIISTGPRLTELFYQRITELETAGWATPMRPTHDAHLFYITRDHRRASLSYIGVLKHPDGHTETLSPEQLIKLVRENPDAMSPKAALRPVYQDYILPTVAYVAGPGEMDYHTQLTPFYRQFGVVPPSLFPRWSATIADHKLLRMVEKSGLTAPHALTSSAHDLAKEVLREADDGHAAQLFAASRAQIEEIFHHLREHVAAIDPTLAAAAQSSAGRALHPLEQLQEKTERALKQKHAAALARLEKILNALRPHEKLAERVLCTGYYLSKYGPEKLLAALDDLPALAKEHFVLTME
jgi:bacillithiol biosynthesis cysteine-adding enzyme BshC